MSYTEQPPRMVQIQTADGVKLPETPYNNPVVDWGLTLSVEELAKRIEESMEYDIGYHILVFRYGCDPDSMKRMSREVVRAFGRGGVLKQTHCYECGQTLPDCNEDET